ncbi:MAG: hypothetical protein FWG77_11670 [Treponema sp.]|nr:hypothetical protein [Treponema sp.]
MIKLIAFILVFALFMVFIVLNLEHRSDVSFGLITFENIPVFVSVLASFALGMLFSIPLSFTLRKKKKVPAPMQTPAITESETEDKIKKEVSPYGID